MLRVNHVLLKFHFYLLCSICDFILVFGNKRPCFAIAIEIECVIQKKIALHRKMCISFERNIKLQWVWKVNDHRMKNELSKKYEPSAMIEKRLNRHLWKYNSTNVYNLPLHKSNWLFSDFFGAPWGKKKWFHLVCNKTQSKTKRSDYIRFGIKSTQINTSMFSK